MYRATTPTHRFTFPADIVPLIDKVKITYAQKNEILFELDESVLVWDGNVASITLSQEQANLFNSKKVGQVQLRVLTVDGSVLATEIFDFEVGYVLDDEVMTS